MLSYFGAHIIVIYENLTWKLATPENFSYIAHLCTKFSCENYGYEILSKYGTRFSDTLHSTKLQCFVAMHYHQMDSHGLASDNKNYHKYRTGEQLNNCSEIFDNQ